MKNQKILFYFTTYYPYGFAEQFIENEIMALSMHYDKIILFPLISETAGHNKILPENVHAYNEESPYLVKPQKLNLLKQCFTVLKITASEVLRRGGLRRILGIRTLLVEINQSIHLSRFISNQKSQYNNYEVSYYSTWMNQWALALSVLYGKREIKNFTFKMRGFDLFDERRLHNFMPFRNFIFKHSSSRLCMSHEGVSYLKEKGFSNVVCNYPGIKFGKPVNKSAESVYTIVSCSNIIKLKRVTLIAASIAKLNFDVKWIHFGDGPEMPLVREIIGKFPDNISVELKGRVTNAELINFYSVNKVDLFIHLSLTEGFGYSIIEAFSFGIPAVLFPGGAVKELIDEKYCVAVSGSDSREDIANLISVAREKFNLTSEFRLEIINSCKQKFDINYQGKELYSLIEGHTLMSNFPDQKRKPI